MDDLTILVIEDDETIRALLRRAFTRSGAQVVEAEDGAAGMRAIYADKPDAVLLDVEMPGIDGWEVLARLRERGEPRRPPVVMLSAEESEAARSRALAAGASEYFSKPVRPAEFADRIAELIAAAG
jgi:DNA-binding response OmpR family regulator